MTTDTVDTSAPLVPISEEQKALQEVRDAANNAMVATETEGATEIRQQLAEITPDQIARYRERAAAQRKRGVHNLSKRFAGVPTVEIEVKINERPISSSFERNFASIENSIYTIGHRGEMFVGDAAAEKLMTRIAEMVEKLEENLEAKKVEVSISLDSARKDPGFLIPHYTEAASTHKVGLRTKLSHRIVQAIMGYDKVLADMQALHWNQVIDTKYIADTEYELKKSVQTMQKFLQRTLRAMYDKATKEKAAVSADPS